MSRVVVTPRPLPPPFRAPARRERLLADGQGLHWQRADGRTTNWAHGAQDAAATVQVLSAARAPGLRGVPRGPLLVVGDAADLPLLVVPVADWAGAPAAAGQGDPLRGTALRPLVDALRLAARTPRADEELAAVLAAGVPVAAVEPRWSLASKAAAVFAAVAVALGTALGIARGRSVPLAALALVGLVGLVAVGVVPLLRARLAERQAAGTAVASVRAGGRRRPVLLLVRTGRGLELGAREADGVERWLPVRDGGVTSVRRTGAVLELLDDAGRVLLALDARRWVPDAAAEAELAALCTAAGLELHHTPGRNASPPAAGSDLPLARHLWPFDYPATPLAGVAAFLGVLNGWALWRDAQLAGERELGTGFLGVGVLSLGVWAWARRHR